MKGNAKTIIQQLLLVSPYYLERYFDHFQIIWEKGKFDTLVFEIAYDVFEAMDKFVKNTPFMKRTSFRFILSLLFELIKVLLRALILFSEMTS